MKEIVDIFLEATSGMSKPKIMKAIMSVLTKTPMSVEDVAKGIKMPQLSNSSIKAHLMELEKNGKVREHMKKGVSYFSSKAMTEETVSGDVASGDLPLGVIDSWKRMVDYNDKMKSKFSYWNAHTKTVSSGHKGHMTKHENNFEASLSVNKLDRNLTVKRLMSMYPPKYI